MNKEDTNYYPKNKNVMSNNARYIIFTIIVLFVSIRIFEYLETEYFIIWFDSAQFSAASLASIWTKEFWFDGIPPLYPFFLKYFHSFATGSTLSQVNILSIFTYSPKIIKGIEIMPDYPFYLVKDNFDVISVSIFQLIFSVFSWIVFAISFSNILNTSYIRLIALILLLFLGIESSVVLWDKHILTESISISLLLLTISFLIHIKQIMNRNILTILFIFVLIFLSFIKITNNYFLILLTPFIIFNFFMCGYKNKSRYGAIITILFSLFIFNQYMLFSGDRTHVPMKDLISSRISTSGYEDIYKYFREAGMPEVPKDMVGKLWTAPFDEYPELHDWWLSQSSGTYQKYLLTHPAYFFFKPFQYNNDFNKPVYSYFTPDLHFHEQVVPNKVKIMFTDIFLWIISSTILFLLILVFIKKINIPIGNLMLPVLLLLISSISYLIIWHADLGELDRHLVQCALTIRIGLLMILIILFDILKTEKLKLY